MATLSTQLENLCRRIHIIGDKFRSTKLRPTQAQTKVYHELASTLTQLTGELSDAIVAATPENPSQERGRELVMHARLNDILNKTILKRNLVLIFKGPEESALDSDQVKARKRVTQQRCVQILNLRPEAIFLWANSFAPSLWAPGALSQDIFGYLVEELKSDASGRLPLEACSVLRTLGAEEPLSAHPMYEEMVKALVERATSLSLDDHPERRCQVEAIMTKRQLNGIPPDTNESAAVDASTRQIQYMFSKASSAEIPLLGDLLTYALQSSNQWKLEKRLGENVTECIAMLVPAGENEDISITLWVGQREAARMIEQFRLQRTWSALSNRQ